VIFSVIFPFGRVFGISDSSISHGFFVILQSETQLIRMIAKEEILELLKSTESYRVERTISTGNMDKFCEAICAFANDMPASRKNGYLIIGANDDGSIAGMKVDDALLKKIAGIRSDGNILPLPTMSVERFTFPEGDLLVAEVRPSDLPPVRYRGRVFIRIGPRRDIATEAEEIILTERRCSFMATFDVMLWTITSSPGFTPQSIKAR